MGGILGVGGGKGYVGPSSQIIWGAWPPAPPPPPLPTPMLQHSHLYNSCIIVFIDNCYCIHRSSFGNGSVLPCNLHMRRHEAGHYQHVNCIDNAWTLSVKNTVVRVIM